MFDNTAEAFRKTGKAFRLLCGSFTLLTQLIYIIYLIICITSDTGSKVTNICMLSLAGIYFLYSLSLLIFDNVEGLRKTKRRAKRIYALLKRLVQISMIITALYNMSAATPAFKPIAVLICTVMIIFFIIQLFFELIIWIFTARVRGMKKAIATDLTGTDGTGARRPMRIGARDGDVFAEGTANTPEGN